MPKFATRFLKNVSGATAIEYGLIAALIVVMCIGVISAVGNDVNATFFTAISNGLASSATK